MENFNFHNLDGTSFSLMAPSEAEAREKKNLLLAGKLRTEIFKIKYADASELEELLTAAETVCDFADLYYTNMELVERKGNEALKKAFNARKAEVAGNPPSEAFMAQFELELDAPKLLASLRETLYQVEILAGALAYYDGISAERAATIKAVVENAQALLSKHSSTSEKEVCNG